MSSLLFERVSKSKDQAGVLELSKKGQVFKSPIDTLKDPLILEFLDLPDSTKIHENKLEMALLNNMQRFLLELGTGFAFMGRQKRITLNGDHFYPDLLFYHAILKCYVIIDLKTSKLTHNDIGQMQMYVNYFDRKVAKSDDNPSIGLILCTEKNNMMVEYTLGENSKQIFASKYQLHLPSAKQLETELRREIMEYEDTGGE